MIIFLNLCQVDGFKINAKYNEPCRGQREDISTNLDWIAQIIFSDDKNTQPQTKYS